MWTFPLIRRGSMSQTTHPNLFILVANCHDWWQACLLALKMIWLILLVICCCMLVGYVVAQFVLVGFLSYQLPYTGLYGLINQLAGSLKGGKRCCFLFVFLLLRKNAAMEMTNIVFMSSALEQRPMFRVTNYFLAHSCLITYSRILDQEW